MERIECLRLYYEKDELDRALDIANELIASEMDLFDAYLWRGKVFYRKQQWGNAINDYHLALELNPESEEARAGVEMAKSILDYFTPDMFNP